MVYNLNKVSGKKKERKTITGKLISLSSDESKCKDYDPVNGKYSWVRLSLVVGHDSKTQKDVFFNVTCFDIDMNKMPELKKADELLASKRKPLVAVQYYESVVDATDKDNNPIFDEVEEERDGKVYVIKVQKKWVNNRCSAEDVVKGLHIIADDTPKEENYLKEYKVEEERVD